MSVILALDLSTTTTGYSTLSLATKELLTKGVILPDLKNPKTKGVAKYEYPEWQTLKIRRLVVQILELIELVKPEVVVIEEICRHKSRLSGKVLDGLHFMLLDQIVSKEFRIKYVDVSGTFGWRPHFDIRLTEADKEYNKKSRTLNKKLKRVEKKAPIVDWKTLSSRYVNKRFKLQLDPHKTPTDGDIADAIMVGLYYLETACA